MIEFLKWFTLTIVAMGGGILIALFMFYSIEQKQQQRSTPTSLIPYGRSKKLFSLADRIRTGQSSALIGLFSEERRTILGYLRNEEPKQQEELYGDKATNLLFAYIDVLLLGKECKPKEFWQKVLEQPTIASLFKADDELAQAYQTCQVELFNRSSLDNLVSRLNQKGKRLVLLWDNVQELLGHPYLDNEVFLGDVRTLASTRTPSPLVIVIAMNISLKEFHERTKDLNQYGSPFLNFLEGGLTILDGLSEEDIEQFLNQYDLSKKERQLVKEMAGGHPYLLEIVTKALLESAANRQKESLDQIEQELFRNTGIQTMLERLKLLSSTTCRALLAVAQQADVTTFEQELKNLERQGFIAKVKEQWQIRARIILKFLRDAEKSGQPLCKE
jgi:hypothetical protein